MSDAPDRRAGVVVDVLGPVVRVRLEHTMAIAELVWVGDDRLYGEVIGLDGDTATLQVYESTAGLQSESVVVASGHPLRVRLGPGLLGSVFDGLQRPLDALAARDGDFMRRGQRIDALDVTRRWTFTPSVQEGAEIADGTILGSIAETPAIEHRVLAPRGTSGRVRSIAPAGSYRIDDPIVSVLTTEGRDVSFGVAHDWPVRQPRPFARRLPLDVPLITGQRVLDTFFPIPAGGTVAMPGGFGTGKTVLQHQLCKWADADVIVFVGCGERGNEMAEVLSELPSLVDPRSGRPLSERTVLIANTSDMPVAAREASIHVGATIAEFYRDMGYRVLLLADSTSRWAEALREISGRLEEMPAEEGYPPYLASRLAAFYERAGRVVALSEREGSLTIIGAISPAGGDLTEPVTRHSERLARAVWSLDRALANARHFPAVSIPASHTGSADQLSAWWRRETGGDWARARAGMISLLEEADRLETTARLIGSSSLPERQQIVLAFAGIFEEAFLRQYAGSGDDWSSPRLQLALLELLDRVARKALAAADAGASARDVLRLAAVVDIRRARQTIGAADSADVERFCSAFERECDALVATAGAVS
jgi:V/A-type H+-transporting ATPase subunit A